VSLLGLVDLVGSSEFAVGDWWRVGREGTESVVLMIEAAPVVSNVPLLRNEAAILSALKLDEERPNCSASCESLPDEPLDGVRDATFCIGIMLAASYYDSAAGRSSFTGCGRCGS
jgi:hypothetical protein